MHGLSPKEKSEKGAPNPAETKGHWQDSVLPDLGLSTFQLFVIV